MIKKNRITTISELKEEGSQSVVTSQREYNFDYTPIIIPIQLDGVTSCAFNPQKNLLLVYGFIVGGPPNSNIRRIYTTEGYYVTTLPLDSISIHPWSNMTKFCDHFIVNYGFEKCTFGDKKCEIFFNLNITRHNEYNFRRVKSIDTRKTIENSFLDCDNNGKIYVIFEDHGRISVYDSDLDFECDLKLGRRETGVIVAINIHDDYLTLLEYIIGGRVIQRFKLFTREHIETVQIDSYQLYHPNRINSDVHNNILIYSASAFNPWQNYSKSISVLYEKGKTRYYTLPDLNYSGKSEKDSHLEFAITDNYQLISVMESGFILIYNLV